MKKKKVCVIGLGYVGLSMAIVISNAKKKNKFEYKTFGYDKSNKKIKKLNQCINKAKLPFNSSDILLKKKFRLSSLKNKINLIKNISEINKMDVIVVSVGFDFIGNKNSFKNILNLINKISKYIKKGALLLIETTLPPGTFQKILIPKINNIIKKRNLGLNDIFLSYSCERIMPGKNYYNSIINNYRCYSGYNKSSKQKVKNFLKSFINYKKFPLTELNSITECETAKVLENSYRATNIALIDEWVNYANLLKIDLLKVIEAIKIRPTHSNIMLPGLGVGGYCLPKDGLFATRSAKLFFKKKIDFPFIKLSSRINNNMPNSSFSLIKEKIKNLKNKKILIMGLSYKEDIDDTRNSASIILYKKLIKKGSKITFHDPLVNEKENITHKEIPKFEKFDLIAFCVKHKDYKKISLADFSRKPVYFDLNNVLEEKKINYMKRKNYKLFILGRYSE